MTFYILAGFAVVSAMLMVSHPKALHSFIFFALTILATSGIFLQLHAGLLFAAQLVAIACAAIGLVLFAVEVTKLDVTAASAEEYPRGHKAAAVIAGPCLAAQVALTILQRRLLPGESLTVLLPTAPEKPPLLASELLKFFLSYNLLPLVLVVFVLLIAIVGTGMLSRKKA